MSVDLSNVINEMHTNMVASFLANIFRLKTGYIYIKLDGIDPQKLGNVLQSMLGNDYDVKMQVEKGGLAVMVSLKK
ncbi:MAG: hypothetical protein L7H04_08335 [Vulcanisaeta sp.]|nr:hypothetical protein [Vulcanisaeta sp.]